VAGTAALVIFQGLLDADAAEDAFSDPNVDVSGYWKVGSGGDDPYYQPLITNNINTILTSGGLTSQTVTSSGSDGTILINFEVPKDTAYTINEIGVFDKNSNIHYYTRCSDLHKPDGVELHIKYRIRKE
jgi:hypothetical protein